MRNRRIAGALLGACLGVTASVAAGDDAPLSAIPWLSDTLEAPTERYEPPATPLDDPAPIDVAPLEPPELGTTGLISPVSVGLTGDLWAASDTDTVTRLMRAMPGLLHPALQTLFRNLVLAEAIPPTGSGEAFLLARVDALLTRGDLVAAQSLLERAGPDTPELFRRWFDISLLLGTEDRGCATLAAKPDLVPNIETKVFCLARSGRWPTAALTLETALALDRITPEARDRMARFLDPELFEGEPSPPLPDPITPLDFRLLEAVGEPIPTRDLPLAFAQTDLRHIIGWKAQIEAAERLARAGALPVQDLLAIYTARRAAASGGVWDRVDLIQRLDVALTAGNANDVANLLPRVREAMHQVTLDAVLAALVQPRLERLRLPASLGPLVYEMALLSNGRARLSAPPVPPDTLPSALQDAAAVVGQDTKVRADVPLAAALAAGLEADTLPASYADLVAQNRTGEALLLALRDLSEGHGGDPTDAGEAVQLLTALGLGNTARHAAAQILLLDPRG